MLFKSLEHSRRKLALAADVGTELRIEQDGNGARIVDPTGHVVGLVHREGSMWVARRGGPACAESVVGEDLDATVSAFLRYILGIPVPEATAG